MIPHRAVARPCPTIYALVVDPVSALWVMGSSSSLPGGRAHRVPNVMASALRASVARDLRPVAGGELYGIAGVAGAAHMAAARRLEFFSERIHFSRDGGRRRTGRPDRRGVGEPRLAPDRLPARPAPPAARRKPCALVRETQLSLDDVVMPLFACREGVVSPVPGLTRSGVSRRDRARLPAASPAAQAVLFHGIPEEKDEDGRAPGPTASCSGARALRTEVPGRRS